MSLLPTLCFLLILSSATAVVHGSKSLEEAMSVRKFGDVMKSATAVHTAFQIAYNEVAVEEKMTFEPLLKGVGELIAFASSMLDDPIIAIQLMDIPRTGKDVVDLVQISKTVLNYFWGTKDDSDFQRQVEVDIRLLKNCQEGIKSHVKELGDRIVMEIHSIKSILNFKNTEENQLKLARLIGEFNHHVHMIRIEIKQCQARLSSILTKINERLNLRWGLVIGGSVTSGVAAALMTNPITGLIIAVFAGISIARGVVPDVKDAERRNELEGIKIELASYLEKIKDHVEMLIADGIPVANIVE